MRFKFNTLFFLIFSFCLITPVLAEEPTDGRSVAFDKKLGNCLACHAIPNDSQAKSPGDIGPPLVGMKLRYPDRAKLRAQIWDATIANPRTGMPPFGRNKILTEPEIDLVTDYIYGQ
jgi:L-cysteine S-thiosulfotransferase